MSGGPGSHPAVAELSDLELADGLIGGAVGERWSERAAIGLIVAHGRWLSREELRRAVETELGLDGELFAWVVWNRVDVGGVAASSEEVSVLALACSLGGVASDRPLAELLCGLDATNTIHVLNAVWVACTGHTLTRAEL